MDQRFHYTTCRGDGKTSVSATSQPLTTLDLCGAPSPRPTLCADRDKKGQRWSSVIKQGGQLVAGNAGELRDAYTKLIEWVEHETGGFDWFATFTFKSEPGEERAERQYRLWTHRLNQAVYGRRYYKTGVGVWQVRASEMQKRGVVHFHSLLGGVGLARDRLEWKENWLTQDPINGFARIYQYDPKLGARSYCAKYVSKGAVLDFYLPPIVDSWLCHRANYH